MSRYEGAASIRRALNQGGVIKLDVNPDDPRQPWQWTVAAVGSERDALACGLTAISSGLKVYVILPDDPKSIVLDAIGLTDLPDPQPKPD